MSSPNPPGDIPPGKQCPTCGEKKTPLKISAGKYAAVGTIITFITQLLCSYDIHLVP